METKQAFLDHHSSKQDLQAVKIGNILRVRVIKKISDESLLVEFNGGYHIAHVDKKLQSKIFIARVLNIVPRIKLKFIKSLEGERNRLNHELLSNLSKWKKSIIQEFFTSDNFFIKLQMILQSKKQNIKESLKKSLQNLKVVNLLNEFSAMPDDAKGYYVLQNIYNILHGNSYVLLFPIKIGEKDYLCDFKIFHQSENLNNTFILTIYLDDETKIGFLVLIDYERIYCTISTNNLNMEGLIRQNVYRLIENLKSLKYNRDIEIEIVPYDENFFIRLDKVKGIDVKL